MHLLGQQDGITTAMQLREHFDFTLIYMTACLTARERERAAGTDPVAWLRKPYTPSQLDSALQIAGAAYRAKRPSSR